MIKLQYAEIEKISGSVDRYAYVSFPTLFSRKSADLLNDIINFPIELRIKDSNLKIDHATANEVGILVRDVFSCKITPWVMRSNSISVTDRVWLKEKAVFRNQSGELMLFVETTSNEIVKWWPADCNTAMFKEYVDRYAKSKGTLSKKEIDLYKVQVLFAKLINLYNEYHPELTDDLIPIRKAIFSNEVIEIPLDVFLVAAINNALKEYDRFLRGPGDFQLFADWKLKSEEFEKLYGDSKNFHKIVIKEYDRIMNLSF